VETTSTTATTAETIQAITPTTTAAQPAPTTSSTVTNDGTTTNAVSFTTTSIRSITSTASVSTTASSNVGNPSNHRRFFHSSVHHNSESKKRLRQAPGLSINVTVAVQSIDAAQRVSAALDEDKSSINIPGTEVLPIAPGKCQIFLNL
jgi:hypothetical protein